MINKLKNKILFTLLPSLFFLISLPAYSENNQLGAGIILGEPTGVCLKYWTGGETAVDLALGWSFSNDDMLHIHADYMYHNFSLIKPQAGRLPLYFGIGGCFKYREDPDKNRNDKNDERKIISIRIPVGLAYIFEKPVIDIFLEIVPMMEIIPDTDFDINAALGARYYF